MVIDATNLAHRVHSPHGVADVYRGDAQKRRNAGAYGAATRHVAAHHKLLILDSGFVTELDEVLAAGSGGGIAMIGIDLDHRAFVDHGRVVWIILFHVRGMKSVRHICRDEEALAEGTEVVFLGAVQLS